MHEALSQISRTRTLAREKSRKTRSDELIAGLKSIKPRHDGQSGIGTRPNRRRRSRKEFLKGNRDFFLGSFSNFLFFEGAFIQEFKIPDRHFRHWWRHQYRRSTPLKGALNGSLWSADLVIKDVSDEILKSRTGVNSLEAILNDCE